MKIGFLGLGFRRCWCV